MRIKLQIFYILMLRTNILDETSNKVIKQSLIYTISMKFSVPPLVSLGPISDKHKQYVLEDTSFESHQDKTKLLSS